MSGHAAQILQIRNRSRDPLLRRAQVGRQIEPPFLFLAAGWAQAVLHVAAERENADAFTLRAWNLGGGHARSINLGRREENLPQRETDRAALLLCFTYRRPA